MEFSISEGIVKMYNTALFICNTKILFSRSTPAKNEGGTISGRESHHVGCRSGIDMVLNSSENMSV